MKIRQTFSADIGYGQANDHHQDVLLLLAKERLKIE